MTFPRMDKFALTRSIISQLEAELALQTEAALGSRDEATNEESRAEDKYDMRSQSAAYLAAGQAKLATDIAAALKAWNALVLRKFGPGRRDCRRRPGHARGQGKDGGLPGRPPFRRP